MLSMHCLYQAIGKSARGNRFFWTKVYRDGTALGAVRDFRRDSTLVIELLFTSLVETAACVHHKPDASRLEHSRTEGRIIIPTAGLGLSFLYPRLAPWAAFFRPFGAGLLVPGPTHGLRHGLWSCAPSELMYRCCSIVISQSLLLSSRNRFFPIRDVCRHFPGRCDMRHCLDPP